MAEYIQSFFEGVKFYFDNFIYNATHMFDGMNTWRYIRLVLIIVAYVSVRPLIEKFIAKTAKPRLEKQNVTQPTEEDKEKTMAAISPNALRGEKVVAETEVEGAKATGVEGGKGAKKRGKQGGRKIKAMENAPDEEDDWTDPEIEDLLTPAQLGRA